MMNTFEKLGIEENIQTAITAMGFAEPMPIQKEVIPYLLGDTPIDLVALAQTGTGKTAAFGLPAVQKTDTTNKHTQYLILSPTRELCIQIAKDLTNYAKNKTDLRIVTVYGGASIENQIKQIKKGAHIISATPGRLLDMINRRVVDISHIKMVILDEADEMLNMGFRQDLETILERTPDQKNTLLFSATMSAEIRSVANRYMNKPVEISVGKRNTGADNIEHRCYTVRGSDKYAALTRLVHSTNDMYGIIFCRTRLETKKIADALVQDGFSADALHGDLSQQQRDLVMNKFRRKNICLLVATDVAARGLDVNDLTHIINYQLPDDSEVYLHRSGRTGRIGKSGISVVLVNNREAKQLGRIERQLQKKFVLHQIPSQEEISTTRIHTAIDNLKTAVVDRKKIAAILPKAIEQLEQFDRDDLIEKFIALELEKLQSDHSSESDLNEIFTDKKRRNTVQENGKFTRFFINIGKIDQLKPAKLINMINDFTGSKEITIGQIEILNNFSFFETDSTYVSHILNSFHSKTLKKRPIVLERAESKTDDSKNRKNRKRKFAGQF